MSTEFQYLGDIDSPRKQVAQLCHWIDANIHAPIGWADLTRQSGMDHKLIMASFNKHLATTPMTWIRQRREQLKTAVATPTVETHTIAYLLKGAQPCAKSMVN
jgi:AraC-like DNA-binding protein